MKSRIYLVLLAFCLIIESRAQDVTQKAIDNDIFGDGNSDRSSDIFRNDNSNGNSDIFGDDFSNDGPQLQKQNQFKDETDNSITNGENDVLNDRGSNTDQSLSQDQFENTKDNGIRNGGGDILNGRGGPFGPRNGLLSGQGQPQVLNQGQLNTIKDNGIRNGDQDKLNVDTVTNSKQFDNMDDFINSGSMDSQTRELMRFLGMIR